MHNKVHFQNRSGQRLSGILHEPDEGPVRAAALFAHCFTCTKNVLAAVNICDALAAAGFLVLRFDFTGLGESEGDFADTHFTANVLDLVDAAAWMEREWQAPDLLAGHSLGGTAVLAAAHQVDSVRAVATIGSPADAEHVLHLIADDLETIEREGEAEVRLAGRPFHLRREFVDDVRSQSVRDGVRNLRRALLVMHSPVDELVSIDEAARIYASAMHPKSFVSLDRADHLLSNRVDSAYAGQVLAAWASRYLADAPAVARPARNADGAVVVEGAARDGFRVAISANGHPLTGDEPFSVGGTNTGPTPYDMLAAALGACTVMTLNHYARRAEIPLDSVEASVTHERVHAKDCEECATRSGMVDRLRRRLRLRGELHDDDRQTLLEIADRCPVHKTLNAEIRIDTELAGDESAGGPGTPGEGSGVD